jgi:hypothetical protein
MIQIKPEQVIGSFHMESIQFAAQLHPFVAGLACCVGMARHLQAASVAFNGKF